MASVKNTRSMPVPLMLSLYRLRNMFNLSLRLLKDSMGSYNLGISKLVPSGSSPAPNDIYYCSGFNILD